MNRRIVGPFNRVEGDLEVQLDIREHQVRDAWVVSPLYRGFEQMLRGKAPDDAMAYVPRICGICSVAQSVAAAQSLANAQGLSVPANGRIATNLILANENLADHLTHFYLFFMPDFAREQYQAQNWFPSIETRFKALKGSATEQVLPARAQFLHIMGLLAGKWPHTLAIQPGGNTVGVEARTKTTLRMIIHEFRRFLEQVLFGDRLEAIIALDSKAALEKWQDQASWESSDFRRFLHLSRLLHLERLGRANDCFMSYGVYDEPQGRLFRSGIWQDMLKPLDTTLIHEDLSHAWMRDAKAPRHPFEGQTLPSLDNKDAYSWCKAPRLDGQVMEVGALARQVVDGHPMIRDLVARSGGNVQNRVIARLLELALVTLAMQRWVEELVPGQPCHTQGNMPDESRSAGMIEAARGSLGHWLRLEKGQILNYQIIAPTTWNFSPRDASGTRGALEQALIGAPAGTDEENPVSVQHIVRSFDPCMVCTVH